MMDATTALAIVPVESVAQAILFIRGQRVILDSDLARFYGVSTKQLNQAVKRNQGRFPADFIVQLTPNEKDELVTNCDRFNRLKHSTTLPYAFTEHGALQAANVLNSPLAADASVYVIRAFIRLREILSTHAELSQKMSELETRLDAHDGQILALIEAIRGLLTEPDTSNRRIGFRTCEGGDANETAAVDLPSSAGT